MLTIWGSRGARQCDGQSRRDFLRVGVLGGTGLTLPWLLRSRAEAGEYGATSASPSAPRKSVIWLWLGGGATHVETFDPKMSAPAEFRSMVGEVATNVSGITLGGLFPKMAQRMDKLVVVRSFAHDNSGHGGGTHWVMTGYNHPPADAGEPPISPSFGSALARYRGPNDPKSGLPTYVRISDIYGDGPAWLGSAAAPFNASGEARNNMELRVELNRVSDRRGLLHDLDRLNRKADRTGLMQGLDSFEGQAFDLVLGNSKEAFDISKEDQSTRDRYGQGIGEQLLLARRLCERGCGFVTMHYGGWDMHGELVNGMRDRCPPMDQAVATLIDDLTERGLSDDVLLVITGEFGRTPRINGSAGRDHWAPLSPLALACGGLRTGQVVGASSAKAEVPQDRLVTPQDLMATLFHYLEIPQDLHYTNPSGRPTPLVSGGRVISEIV